MSIITDLEYLKNRFLNGQIDIEECGSKLVILLNHLLDEQDLDSKLKGLISDSNAVLDVIIQNIKDKTQEIRLNETKTLREELNELKVRIRKIISDILHSKGIKKYLGQRFSQESLQNKSQNLPSSSQHFDEGKSASPVNVSRSSKLVDTGSLKKFLLERVSTGMASTEEVSALLAIYEREPNAASARYEEGTTRSKFAN